MELQDFIRETLTEIAFGVHEAKVEAKDVVAICPGVLNKESVEIKTDVNFEIAVTAQAEQLKVLEGSVDVKGIGLGRKRQTTNADEKVHRIQFTVPILLNAHFRNSKTIDADAEVIKKLVSERKKRRAELSAKAEEPKQKKFNLLNVKNFFIAILTIVLLWLANTIIQLENFHYAAQLNMCSEYTEPTKKNACLENTQTRSSPIWHLLYALKIIN